MLRLFILTACFYIACTQFSFAISALNSRIVLSGTSSSIQDPGKPGFIVRITANMKMKDLKKLAGRRLTLKEKLAFKIFQYKARREMEIKESVVNPKRSKTAFVFGILGIVLNLVPFRTFFLGVPFAIAAILMGSKSLKENPSDKKAKAARTMGFISLVIAVLWLLAGIFTSSFGFY